MLILNIYLRTLLGNLTPRLFNSIKWKNKELSYNRSMHNDVAVSSAAK